MRRALAWLALAIFAGCTIYGLFHDHLFAQMLWTEGGMRRFIRLTIGYCVFAGLIVYLRPKWLLPVVSLFVLIYSTWWSARFFSGVAPFAVLYFLGSCYFLGRWITKQADAITAFLVGLAIWALVISLVAPLPVNYRAVYWVAIGLPYLKSRSLTLPAPWADRKTAAAGAALLYVLLMNWFVTLKPEVSSDGLAMHLAIPMTVAYDHRWSFDVLRYSYAVMPMNGDWSFTATYMLGGEAASRLFNFAMLTMIAAMVYRESRRWLSPATSLLATALFVSTPMVELVTGSLFVENVWAAMIVGGTLALARGEIVWAGLLFGSALASKVGTTAFLVPALFAAIVAIRKIERPWRTAGIAAGLLLLFGAPPYANAYARTHNPLFPFYNHIFRSPLFDTEPTSMVDPRPHEHANWTTPYKMTFRSKDYFEGHDGSMGFQYFLLFAPLLLLLKRGAPLIPFLVGTAGAAISFLTIPNLRYMYPALPLISIGLAWLLAEMPLLIWVAAAVIALNAWFFPASSWYHGDFGFLRKVQLDEYMKISGPQRALVDYLNRTAPGEPVAFFSGSPIAGLHARAYSDQWRTYDFWKAMIAAHSEDDLSALYHKLGIKHVITPIPFEADYVNEQHFLAHHTRPTGVKVGRWALLDVIDVAPPAPAVIVKPEGVYDDVDDQIDYRGEWDRGHDFDGAAGKTDTFSRLPGDSLTLKFNGPSIAYFYTKAVNRGIAEVLIDGQSRGTIDLYSSQTRWQSRTVYRGLGPGGHTIEIRVTGEKNPKASDRYVDLDQFVAAQN